MELAEIRFICKAFIKERGAKISLKNLPVPHPVALSAL
jgi:hypothetical protein